MAKSEEKNGSRVFQYLCVCLRMCGGRKFLSVCLVAARMSPHTKMMPSALGFPSLMLAHSVKSFLFVENTGKCSLKKFYIDRRTRIIHVLPLEPQFGNNPKTRVCTINFYYHKCIRFCRRYQVLGTVVSQFNFRLDN